jgi:toxin FitB
VRYLLDTNVISEWVKPQPAAQVVEWLHAADEDRLYLSVVSFAEIQQGVELLSSGARRNRFADWLSNDLKLRFEGRILIVDEAIARQWGVCMAKARKGGTPIGSMDAFVGATALVHDLTLVTGNTRDFAALGLRLFNPWDRKL